MPINKTLRQYIDFLHENKHEQEASYYEHDVVTLLESRGFVNALDMDTKEVVSALYAIQDNVTAELASIPPIPEIPVQMRIPWEVELHG